MTCSTSLSLSVAELWGAGTITADVVRINAEKINLTSTSAVSCGELMCRIQMYAEAYLRVGGTLTGGDINITSTGSMTISATISADAMGNGAEAGDGSGESVNSWTTSSSNSNYYDEQSSAGSGGVVVAVAVSSVLLWIR